MQVFSPVLTLWMKRWREKSTNTIALFSDFVVNYQAIPGTSKQEQVKSKGKFIDLGHLLRHVECWIGLWYGSYEGDFVLEMEPDLPNLQSINNY